MPTSEKQTLTEDQIILLSYFEKKGTFDDKDLFAFFSGHELWSKAHKIEVFRQLRGLNLIRAKHQTEEPINEREGIVHHVGWHLTDEAKTIVQNYQAEQKEDAERKRLEYAKLKLDVKNAERINATYWWTFGFALAAFLISLVLLILKIKELADSGT